MTVTRTEPRTRLDAEAEIQYLTHLLAGSPDRSLSPVEAAPLYGRRDKLLEMWAGLPEEIA